MGADLHHVLRSLCFNTEWNCAIFWKLKHRARMVLTWEDAYYDNCEQLDNLGDTGFIKTLEVLQGGHNLHDPLGLAVAKMSYHVYTLGEGIVGKVAITGKHQWIFVDNIVNDNCSPPEYSDGWQSQFLAGVKTVVAVAVVPHGVVQLGSLNKITENVKLVSHIKDDFMAQDFPVRHIQSSVESSVCEAISPKNLASGAFCDCLQDLDKAINREKSDVWLSSFPQSEKDSDSSYMFPLPGNLKNAVEVAMKHEKLESSNIGGDESSKPHQSKSSIFNLGNCKLVGVELLDGRKCTGESNDCKCMGMSSTNKANPLCHANDCADLSSTFVNSVNDRVNLDDIDLYHSEALRVSEPSDDKFQSNLENFKFQSEPGQVDTFSSSLMFPAGCELHEALGPGFMNKSNFFDWEAEKIGDRITAEMPEGVNSSQLTSDICPEHLLEAVVAKVCHSGSHVKSEKSFCKSMQSLLTTKKYPDPSSHTTHT